MTFKADPLAPWHRSTIHRPGASRETIRYARERREFCRKHGKRHLQPVQVITDADYGKLP